MRFYTTGDIVNLIEIVAEEFGLEMNLVLAIATVESSLDCKAKRFEPEWRYPLKVKEYAAMYGVSPEIEATHQATSWGPMQVMGTVLRELGYQGVISNLLDEPRTAIRYGCKKIAELQKRYESEDAVIAAYNAGSARRKQNTTGVGFEWVNQGYVNKVKAVLTRLRKPEGA